MKDQRPNFHRMQLEAKRNDPAAYYKYLQSLAKTFPETWANALITYEKLHQ